jgi:beta-xylosidase
MARAELGINRVRFHGILDDDMSTSLAEGVNSYVSFDSTADFLQENNMTAILELGFMPRWLARGRTGFACNHSMFHYGGCVDPPSNFTQWGEVVGSLVAHLVERCVVVALSFEAISARGMMEEHVCCLSQHVNTSIMPLGWLNAN